MTRLVAVLQASVLGAQVSLAGRFAELHGEGRVYVVETASGDGHYSWYDDPWERVVEFHRNATEAIQARLRRRRPIAPHATGA